MFKYTIGTDERMAQRDRLGDEQPVEWIAVVKRQILQNIERCRLDRQPVEAIQLPLLFDESRGAVWQAPACQDWL